MKIRELKNKKLLIITVILAFIAPKFIYAVVNERYGNIELEIKNGVVQLDCKHVSLKELLYELMLQTNINFVLNGDFSEIMTIQLFNVSIERMLSNIFKNKVNYAILYTTDKIISVYAYDLHFDQIIDNYKHLTKSENKINDKLNIVNNKTVNKNLPKRVISTKDDIKICPNNSSNQNISDEDQELINRISRIVKRKNLNQATSDIIEVINENSNIIVKLQAINALSKIGNQEAINFLKATAKESSEKMVRKNCNKLLEGIKQKRFIE